MSLETMTKLATVTVGAGGQASISFSNIPQGYTDLVLKLSTRTTAVNWTTTGLALTFNGSSASVYSRRTLYNTSAGGGGSDSTSSTTSFTGGIVTSGSSATSNVFGSAEILITNYSENTFKSIFSDNISENNGVDTSISLTSGLFANSSPITSLSLTDVNGGSFVQYSTATLYGVKSAAKTAGNSIKATGGNIVFDGTYVTHTFLSSGTFVPTQAVVADYLVVAGGGGGTSGGGGAGGLRTSAGTYTGGGLAAESKLSLIAGTSYAVTVGAGGNAGYTDLANGAIGTNGSDSAFGTIVSTGGGTGGQAGGVAGATQYGRAGGSGGGAAADGGATNSSGGAGTAGQGYAGAANGTYHSNPYGVGGGGGAAGVATALVGNYAGPGGPGLLWVDGNYYAGGGGGGAYFANSGGYSNAGGIGGGGAGAQANSVAAVKGTANTGGGGGGGANTTNTIGGAGGSGIVIIRYKG